MNESRAKTIEEVRKEFMGAVKGIVRYWSNVESESVKDACDGVAFSILSLIDGCSGNFPGVDLRLSPHKDDKAYNISEGKNWYELNMLINDCMLHEMYHDKITEVKE
jgi:hypothetical protein